MRKLITNFNKLLLAGLMLSSITAGAQTIPGTTGSYQFPQNLNYNGIGRQPTNVSATQMAQDAKDSYTYWKNNFVTTAGCGRSGFRVIFDYFPGTTRGSEDQQSSVSEGIAYGMLLAAYAGDRPLFDGLWSYYKSWRNDNGIMNWQIRNCGIFGQNGASDAELDAAMALIIASYQWQSDAYENDASNLIRIIREKEFEGSILKPGDKFGGSSLTNPSYFSPAYYEVYKDFDPGQDAFWNAAIAKGYEIIDKADKNNIGLVPDWTDGNGNFSSLAASLGYEDNGRNFIFDGIRTPFRSAIDYLWHGRQDAQDYCTRLIDWAYDNHGGGTETLGSKYSIDGQKLNNFHSNTFVGCFSIAAMAAGGGSKSESQYQSFLNRGYADNENTQPGFGEYFNASFKVLSQFVLMGNFYLPPPDQCDGPSINGGDDLASLCNGNVTLDAGVNADNYVWKQDGVIISGGNKTRSVSSPGTYEVVTTIGTCSRRDRITVGAGTVVADFIANSGGGGITVQNTSTGAISDYSWELDNVEVSTDEVPEITGLAAGSYELKLTVTNSGFGCSGTDTKTQIVNIGNGEGIAIDDFNGLFERGVNVYTYGPEATNFDEFPKTWCSRQNQIDGDPQECFDFRCSYLDVKANGSTLNYASIEFGMITPYDLANGAFVTMKISASEPVTIAVRLGTPDENSTADAAGTNTFLSTGQNINVTTTEEVFTFNFTDILTGDVNGTAGTITSWSEVSALTLRPYVNDLTFDGTISIDYVIIGDKALAPPTFDVKKDEFGFPDFGVYRPDYLPGDPELLECTTADAGMPCYGLVPDWKKEVISCNATTVVEAPSCLATDIRWYNGETLIETGATADLAPGEYRVELIGPGGITEDEVRIVGDELEAAFSVTQENYNATFVNQSTGFTSFAWDYGSPAEAGSELWDPGFIAYPAGPSTDYTVSLTVENENCGTTDTETKTITVVCDKFTGDITVTESTLAGCEGETFTFTIDPVENATTYGWFPPQGATIVRDSLTAQVTFGDRKGPLTIEAYNACSAPPTSEKSTVSLELDITAEPDPVVTIDFDENTDGTAITASVVEITGDSYVWTYGDGNGGTGASVSHDYNSDLVGQTMDVCVTATNSCFAAGVEVCEEFIPTTTVGLVDFSSNAISLFPTATTNSLTVELVGQANVIISDVLGNTVSETVISNKGDINVSDLSAGMYILSVEQGGEVVNKRFIKE